MQVVNILSECEFVLSFASSVLDEVRISWYKPPLLPTLPQPLVTDDVTASRETAEELHRATHLE